MAVPQRPAGYDAVRTLHPGYFAFVMATGILSIAMHNARLPTLSAALLGIAAGAYALLVGLTLRRLARYQAEVRVDLADPRRAFGFFTFVAGTDVLGARLVLDGHLRPAAVLLGVGGLSWLVLGYLVPWTALLGRAERPLLSGANGSWFIWVVASQSVAVLAANLEPATQRGRRELAVLAVMSWSVGVFLYAAVGVLVSARLLVYEVRPADVTPPYWVAMGATAISVLAGARIVRMADAPMVDVTRGLIGGSSVFFWAFGTWLVPPLVAAGWWRHGVHHVPLRYEPTWWSIVFPLGMYGVAAHYLGEADRLPLVAAIGAAESWAALAAWAMCSAAMLAHLLHSLGPVRSTSAGGP